MVQRPGLQPAVRPPLHLCLQHHATCSHRHPVRPHPPLLLLPPSAHMPATLRSHACYPPLTCLLPSAHMPATLRSHACYPPLTCLLPSYHMPAALLSCACLSQFPCAVPSLSLCASPTLLALAHHDTPPSPLVCAHAPLSACVRPSLHVCAPLCMCAPLSACVRPSLHVCALLCMCAPLSACVRPSLHVCGAPLSACVRCAPLPSGRNLNFNYLYDSVPSTLLNMAALTEMSVSRNPTRNIYSRGLPGLSVTCCGWCCFVAVRDGECMAASSLKRPCSCCTDIREWNGALVRWTLQLPTPTCALVAQRTAGCNICATTNAVPPLCGGAACVLNATAPLAAGTVNSLTATMQPFYCGPATIDATAAQALLVLRAALGVTQSSWLVDSPCVVAGNPPMPGTWAGVACDTTGQVVSLHPIRSCQGTPSCHVKAPHPVMSRHPILSCQGTPSCHVKAPHPVMSRHPILSCQGTPSCHVKAPHPVMSRHPILSCQGTPSCHVKAPHPVMSRHPILSCQGTPSCLVKAPHPVMSRHPILSCQGTPSCHVKASHPVMSRHPILCTVCHAMHMLCNHATGQ
ncbi:unnamed protein product [Closterium sp. Yama58-4]|nr:unnamed protein product [Closterium sp. Yama58-4]